MTDKLKGKSGVKKRTNSRGIRSIWFNYEAQPEKHYSELPMLFTRWRDEETDLISYYSSFEEHYLARYGEINEQYAVCTEDLNDIQEHMTMKISLIILHQLHNKMKEIKIYILI